MHRLLSLLLIPTCLMGQLFCPHSHVGTGVAEPQGHAVRPHIHLSGGHDHCHGRPHRHHSDQGIEHSHHAAEAAVPESASPLTDHDQDALYFTCHTCDSRIVVAKQTLDFPPAVGLGKSAGKLGLQQWSIADHFDPPDEHGGLPLYLRISSLRI